MKITHRTDYAIHLLAELAQHPNQIMGLRALAESQHVTYAFARTIQVGLLNAGIIESMRGIKGGIQLAKPLHEVTLLEVFEAAQCPLDESFHSKEAVWRQENPNQYDIEGIWDEACETLRGYFGQVKMDEIIK